MKLKDNSMKALLSMQRYSWEQGMAVQAALEIGDSYLLKQLLVSSDYRKNEDGRVAQMGIEGVTDTCCLGEGLVRVVNSGQNNETMFREMLDGLLKWILQEAPRNKEGAIYHVDDKAEFWVDSIYMLPPFLASAGFYEESMKNLRCYIDRLYDTKIGLFRHIWDDGNKNYSDKMAWGIGNGWALTGIARMIDLLPSEFEDEIAQLQKFNIELIDNILTLRTPNQMFHNDLIDNNSFEETNLSQMVAYTIYRGIKSGYIPDSYLPFADDLRKEVEQHVDEYGILHDVCGMPTFDHLGIAPEAQAFFVMMENIVENMNLQETSYEKSIRN